MNPDFGLMAERSRSARIAPAFRTTPTTSMNHSADALAREPSQILVLSEEILDKFLKRKVPRKFLANIIAVLCHRLRATNSMFMRAKYGDQLAPESE